MKLKELSNIVRERATPLRHQLEGPLGLPCSCESRGLLWIRVNSWISHFWPRIIHHRQGLGRAPCESSSLLQSLSKAWKCISGNLRALKAEVPAGASAGALASIMSSWLSADEEINGLSCWPGFLVADHLSRRIIYWRGSRKHTESMGIAEQPQPKGRLQGSLDTGIRQTASTPPVTATLMVTHAHLHSSAVNPL